MMKWCSLLLIVFSGCIYQIMAKNVNQEVNPFATLIITYLVSLLTAVVLFLITRDGKSILEEVKKVNIFSAVLGCFICLYELGFVLSYRYGWSVSSLSPTVSIFLMTILAIIGVFFYKDKLSLVNITGYIVVIIGILMTMKGR